MAELVWGLGWLLVDPVCHGTGPAAELIGVEPEGDLPLSGLGGIGAMDDVTTNVDAEVTPDGARFGLEGVGLADHLAGCRHYPFALPDHSDHGTRGDELHQTFEEGTFFVFGIVGLRQFLAHLDLFEAHQQKTTGLEPLDDGAHQLPLYSIRLDRDKGPFHSLSLNTSWYERYHCTRNPPAVTPEDRSDRSDREFPWR